MSQLTKELLLSNNYWVLNKTMVRLVGIDATFLLSNFAEAETMMADNEGWFYQTSETVEEMTTLSRYKQDRAVSLLEEKGILEKLVKGMPAKRYFRINYGTLTNLFVNNQQTSMRKSNKQGCKKLATSKELTYKELNKESVPPKKAPRKKYGEYQHILLTEAQHTKLINDYSVSQVEDVIKKMDEWIQLKGKPYKDFNLALRKWIREESTKGAVSGQVTGYDFSDELI